MEMILYPEKCKYKYVFITFNQTAIFIFTEENTYVTSSGSSNPFFKSPSKVVHEEGRLLLSPRSHLAAFVILRAEETAFSVNG